jgi:hypothetical protein
MAKKLFRTSYRQLRMYLLMVVKIGILEGALFKGDPTYFNLGEKCFVMNFRLGNLIKLLK